jgi:hypothetical protein
MVEKHFAHNLEFQIPGVREIEAKRFVPFRIVELIGNNFVMLELPDHLRIHPVVHVIHTTPHVDQPRIHHRLFRFDRLLFRQL